LVLADAAELVSLVPRTVGQPLRVALGTVALAIVAAYLRARRNLPLPARSIERLFEGAENVAFVTLGADLRVTRWSRGAEALLGFEAREMVGRPLSPSIVSAEVVDELGAELRRLMQSGKPRPGWRSPVLDREGRTVEAFLTMFAFADVGTREVWLLLLDARSGEPGSEARAKFLDEAPVGLMRVAADGRIELVNKRFVEWTGRRADSVVGADIGRSEILAAPLRGRLRELATMNAASQPSRERAGGPAGPEEVTLTTPSGVVRTVVCVPSSRPEGGVDALFLDRAQSRATANSHREPRTEAPPPTSPDHRDVEALVLRVLLVDDNEENRELIAHMLRLKGAEVVSVASGHEALEAAARGGYRFVLLDIQMPDMDGYEVVRRLRTQPFGAELPVVGLTAFTAEPVLERCLAEGMDDVLSKPVTLASIKEIVARWGPGKRREPEAGD
jgi:CheY-like chemotaxis protein